MVPETVPDSISKYKRNLFLLSWTTTPWSLAANRAIAYNKDVSYVIVQDNHDDNYYIISKDLFQTNTELLDLFSADSVICELDPKEIFPAIRYSHPLKSDLVMNLYHGSHVTVKAGTGLVHTAPGHGQEDFLLGLEHDLDLSCPVDENGCYDSTVMNPQLISQNVLGSGNEKIIELLVRFTFIKELFSILFKFNLIFGKRKLFSNLWGIHHRQIFSGGVSDQNENQVGRK